MLPAYSMFAGAINKAVKGILHFSHIYPNREFKALEERLLIKCCNRFVRDPDGYYTRLSKRDGVPSDPGSPIRCCRGPQGLKAWLPLQNRATAELRCLFINYLDSMQDCSFRWEGGQ